MYSWLKKHMLFFLYAPKVANAPKAKKTTDSYDDFIVIRLDLKKKKQTISKVLRDQVWTTYVGKQFQTKCMCCSFETIDVFHFECGHIVPESKGGSTELSNLRPICRTCNLSMGNQHLQDFQKKWKFSEERFLQSLKFVPKSS